MGTLDEFQANNMLLDEQEYVETANWLKAQNDHLQWYDGVLHRDPHFFRAARRDHIKRSEFAWNWFVKCVISQHELRALLNQATAAWRAGDAARGMQLANALLAWHAKYEETESFDELIGFAKIVSTLQNL